MLIVLRGNSGSGKSTVAALLQEALGTAALLEQDYFCRVIYREPDQRTMRHASLLEVAAEHCLDEGQDVILDGIFNARRYSAMLERITSHSDDARFFAFDLSFEETVRRHALRGKSATVSVTQMRSWYHGWQPLTFVDEHRITAGATPAQITQRILHQPPAPTDPARKLRAG